MHDTNPTMLLHVWKPSDTFERCGHTFESPNSYARSSHPEVFLGKGALEICSKFTGEHPCRSAISIKMLWIFIEITLRHVCYTINLLHIFRTPFLKNTSGLLLLQCLTSYDKRLEMKFQSQHFFIPVSDADVATAGSMLWDKTLK